MRPTKVIQDGIRITQEQPDNVVIEMNGSSITLTEENTELLRVMLYEAYRSKRWKCSRAEKSAKAKAQRKSNPDAHTEKVYKRMKAQADQEVSNIEIIYPDFLDMKLPDFLK